MTKLSTVKAVASKGMRKGMSLIEVSIVLIIAAIIIGGVFMIAPKLMTGAKSDAALNSFAGVAGALDAMKANNAGAYPAQAAATAISAIPAITTELGGANAIKDLAGWTYQCVAGAGASAIIVTSNFESTEARDAIEAKIDGRFQPWAAVDSGTNALTITKANVTCQ